MPRFRTLDAWLTWQETLHPRKIDLGLERVQRVADRLGLERPAPTVVTIAGTNGKGSCCALLATICEQAGYRVGRYTSPHLLRYNERIVIDSVPVSEAALCQAFQRVDEARTQDTLSYFEFGTLAALVLFDQSSLDVAILEIGMGGRLDAVNIVDPDVALVTSIGIDHSAWLGSDRETIGREKAGIFRSGKPAVCADPAPPDSLQQHAAEVGACWFALGEAFDYQQQQNGWSWNSANQSLEKLPLPALPGKHQLFNAAGVLMVLELLADTCPVSQAAIEDGLTSVVLPGRCQFVPGAIETVFDVAHNPESATQLRQCLQDRPVAGATWLVLGMLADKEIGEFMRQLVPVTDHWLFAALPGDRGLDAKQLQQAFSHAGAGENSLCFPNIATAAGHAYRAAKAGDRVVICGSFLSVAGAMDCPV